jgi:tRNA (cytidine/uridine-2'-O-)-methyltransferase
VHVVLVAPQIATNTGGIIRLCANTGADLHLVEPLGFSMADRLLRRAGLDYHDLARVSVHPSLPDCLAGLGTARRFAFRTTAATRYDQVDFTPADAFVFGAERAGLTAAQLRRLAPVTELRLPMQPGNRSLNLANAVAVVVYEAWRQNDFRGAADPLSPSGGAGLTSEALTSGPFDH